MLLNLEQINPIPCETDAFETAVLTVRYSGAEMTVFWCGFYRTPTDAELEKMMVSCILALSTHRLILHIEHVGDKCLEIVTIDMIKNVVGTLLQNKDLLRKSLVGSIFEAQTLTDKTKVMCDLFLSIYKPMRPLCVTDCKSNIEDFVQQLSMQ